MPAAAGDKKTALWYWREAEERDSGLAPGAEESCGRGELHGCTNSFTRRGPDVGLWRMRNGTERQTTAPSACD